MSLNSVTVGIFIGVGFTTVLAIAALLVCFKLVNPESNSSLNVSLKRELNTQRYLRKNQTLPLARKDGFSVTRAVVLEETPTSATFRIHFNAPDDSILDIPSVGMYVLQDSGLPAPFIWYPPTKPDNYGKMDDFYFAVIKVELSKEAKFDLIATNHVLFFFAGINTPAYQEDRFEYERVWCRQPTEISDLLRKPIPEENTSNYSIEGSRSISRLCLDN